MSRVLGPAGQLGFVAVKAALLYLTAVLGLRVGERRTLADMSAFDFVAAVAVGAIVGRVPNAHDAGYLAGAATLVAVLAAHQLVSRLRRFPALASAVDHAPVLVIADGRVRERAMRRSGLTRSDLYGALRRNGVRDLGQVEYAILEPRGQVSVLSRVEAPTSTDGDVLRDVVGPTTSQAAH